MKILIYILVLTVHLCGANTFQYYKYWESYLPYGRLLSEGCRGDLWKFKSELKNVTSWAWKMLDATSKIPSGLEIVSGDLGQFDECIRAQSTDALIYGKYCLGALNISRQDLAHIIKQKENALKNTRSLTGSTAKSFAVSWAGCLPQSCSAEDYDNFYNEMLKEYLPAVSLTFDDAFCSTREAQSEFTTGTYITIGFFLAIFAIMLIETCYDVYCRRLGKVPKPLFIAFSMYTNSGKLFTFSKANNQLECLNGLKFYSMMWVVLGHTYAQALDSPIAGYTDVLDWGNSLYSMLVVSGTLSVDTFFVIGGILVSYVFLQATQKGTKFNILVYYIHRYIRLTPALGALALATAVLYPYFGSGPNWNKVKISQELCQESWWGTILYIQNYVNVPKLCVGHSWYLSVDMQLYILSPIFLYGLKNHAKFTVFAILSIIIVICEASFLLAWINNYCAVLSNPYADNTTFMTDFYLKTHTRAGPWLLGLIVGYYIFEIKQSRMRFRPLKIWNFIGWLLCIALLLTCVFIGHGSLRSEKYDQMGNSLHIGLVRQLWAVGICWIVVSCTFGYGGPFNWFLTFPMYQVFNRFTYSIYLVHFMLIGLWSASARVPIHFSDVMMGYYFWGHLCFTCIISYFWVLAFESPMIVLEKIILGPLLGTKRKNETTKK